MATPEEVNLSKFNDIHHTLTEGKAGVKEVGPVFAHVANAAKDSAAILDALSPGVAGKRHAGHVATALARIESNTAVTQNLVKALDAVAGGESFDQEKLLAGIDKTVRDAMADTVNVTVTVKEQ